MLAYERELQSSRYGYRQDEPPGPHPYDGFTLATVRRLLARHLRRRASRRLVVPHPDSAEAL